MKNKPKIKRARADAAMLTRMIFNQVEQYSFGEERVAFIEELALPLYGYYHDGCAADARDWLAEFDRPARTAKAAKAAK